MSCAISDTPNVVVYVFSYTHFRSALKQEVPVVFDHCMCVETMLYISELYQYDSLHVIFVSMVHMCSD